VPQLTLPQILAVVGALAVAFWPQVKAFAARVPALGLNKPHTAGDPDRSAWVAQLIALQDATRQCGHPNAASLIGQAIVDLVSSEKPAKP
jgi:hypothetical protein